MRCFVPVSILRNFLPVAVLCLLSACSTFTDGEDGGGGGQSAATRPAPGYKVGAPYQINGVWYYPNENYSYDETGIASWYGPGFHRKRTANGEIFDANELTAAHPTLPMPCLARVTNLDNGRSVVVRINDRGPFAHGRLIDVSKRAAQLLSFDGRGTAKVRVQVLAEESKAIADAARRYGSDQTTRAYAGATYAAAPVTPVAPRRATGSYTPPQPPPPERVAHDARETGLDLPVMTRVPVADDAKIYVQAGAFTVAGNADILKRQLNGFGAASVAQTTINGIIFYRVRVGPIADVAKADILLAKIAAAGVPNPRIVVD